MNTTYKLIEHSTTNNIRHGLPVAASLCMLVAWSTQSATLVVDSRCNIWGAGHDAPNDTPQPSGGGGGLAPVSFPIPAPPAQVLTFSSITGTINVNFGGAASPDGIEPDNGIGIQVSPWNGISGFECPRYACLVGVFLSDAEPADPAPEPIDFAAIGLEFTDLQPEIGQVFYIGDGRTESGQVQQFIVPDSATRLFLGIPDHSGGTEPAGWYGDNTGSVTVTSEIPSTDPPLLSMRVSQVELCWNTATNTWYQLQYRSTLTENQWSPLTEWIPGNDQDICINDAVLVGQPQRFYRIAVTHSP